MLTSWEFPRFDGGSDVELAHVGAPPGVDTIFGSLPEFTVEGSDGFGVPEEGEEFAAGEGVGAVGEEAGAELVEVAFFVSGFDFRAAEHRDVDGVGGWGERDVEEAGMSAGCRACRGGVEVLEDGWNVDFLWREEKSHATKPLADAIGTREHGEWNGEDETGEHGRKPDEQCWNPVRGGGCGEKADEAGFAKGAEGVGERNPGRGAVLSFPNDACADEREENKFRVKVKKEWGEENREERIDEGTCEHANGAAEGFRATDEQDRTEDPGKKKQGNREGKEEEARARVDLKFRKARRQNRKVLFFVKIDGAGDDEDDEHGRGEVGHEAEKNVKSICEAGRGREEEPEVLKVALTPAAVAFEAFEEIGRTLFIGSGLEVGEPNLIACEAHERGLNGVMAH